MTLPRSCCICIPTNMTYGSLNISRLLSGSSPWPITASLALRPPARDRENVLSRYGARESRRDHTHLPGVSPLATPTTESVDERTVPFVGMALPPSGLSIEDVEADGEAVLRLDGDPVGCTVQRHRDAARATLIRVNGEPY